MRRWLAPVLVLAPALLLLAASGPASAEADGKALWEKNCQKCHGPDGKGDTPAGKKMKVEPLDAEKLQAAHVIENVRQNKKHKTISKKLDDATLQAIATYAATLGGS